MAIPFNPPEQLINEYLNRPEPIQQGLNSVAQMAQTYLAMKAQKSKMETEALDGYVKAFEAGGPKFAADYAARRGLKNPPALPGLTATMAGPGGTAGVMSNLQPSMQPQVPTSAEDQMQQSLPGEHIVDHWNATMGQPQTPAASSSMAPPGLENPVDLLNQGTYGTKKLAAGESLGKYQGAMQAAAEKDLENAPRSANQLRQDFTLAGQPDKADAWIKAHVPSAMDNPDQPLINVAQIKEAKDWLGTGAMQMRGNYFDTMGNIQTQKLREGLMKDARTTLDPMFQTGEGKAQMQRLNNIGRTEPLITQMLAQKGGGDPRQMVELATRVDSVLKGSPGGQQAVEGINRLVPQTARGKYAGWVEWFSSNPKGTEQQAFIRRYADTIGREKTAIQGQVKQTAERGAGTLRVLRDQFPDDYNAVVNPYLSGKYQELTGNNTPTIANDADFNALPPGAKFKDPSGQEHTKK